MATEILKRKIYDRLLRWKRVSAGKTAALIQGAPRTGKSLLAEEFAKKEYRSYIRIDFATVSEELKDMFRYDMEDLDAFFLKLEVLYNIRLHRRESVIILDEVQWFPQARAMVQYLVKDGRYDYIETGALLAIKESVQGIALPTDVEHMYLHPLDFEEFLWAMGHEDVAAPLRECFEKRKPMGPMLHRKAMNMFRLYLIVGGMPEAVSEYIRSGNLNKVDKVKRNILRFYKDGIRRYGKRSAAKMLAVLKELPNQMKHRNQHFKFATLRQGARYGEFREAIFWLEEAMVLYGCYTATDPSVSMETHQDRTVLKIYMADTGLLFSHLYSEKDIEREELYKKILLANLEDEMGVLLENAVAQMLTASGHKLFFYTNVDREDRMNRMELDFLLSYDTPEQKNVLVPVKVKAGKHFKRSALRKFMAKFPEQAPVAYDLHTGDLRTEKNIVFLPVYMAMLL